MGARTMPPAEWYWYIRHTKEGPIHTKDGSWRSRLGEERAFDVTKFTTSEAARHARSLIGTMRTKEYMKGFRIIRVRCHLPKLRVPWDRANHVGWKRVARAVLRERQKAYEMERAKRSRQALAVLDAIVPPRAKKRRAHATDGES
jgi:hypothetical protein